MSRAVNEAPAYKAGTKAYYDAHFHIIPCTVLEVIEEGNGIYVTSGKLRIRVDSHTGPYAKGEEMVVTGYHTFPRIHRYLSGFHYRINPHYKWIKECQPSSP